MTDQDFYAPPTIGAINYLVNIFRPLANRELEELRKKKEIGKNIQAKLIIYANKGAKLEESFGFYRVWPEIKEIMGVSEVEILESDNFKIEALSLVNNQDYTQCPRCDSFHTRKNCLNLVDTETGKDRFICVKCEKVLINEYSNHWATKAIIDLNK